MPGILSAARYEAIKGGPQYLACYELESVAVMQTPAFTNRPRTPRGQKVSPSVIGKNLTRIVGEQIYPDGMEMPERGMAPSFCLVSLAPGPHAWSPGETRDTNWEPS